MSYIEGLRFQQETSLMKGVSEKAVHSILSPCYVKGRFAALRNSSD